MHPWVRCQECGGTLIPRWPLAHAGHLWVINMAHSNPSHAPLAPPSLKCPLWQQLSNSWFPREQGAGRVSACVCVGVGVSGWGIYGVMVSDWLVRYANQRFLFCLSLFREIFQIARHSWDFTSEQKAKNTFSYHLEQQEVNELVNHWVDWLHAVHGTERKKNVWIFKHVIQAVY